MISKSIIYTLLIFSLLQTSAFTQQSSNTRLITISSGVRVRTQPQLTASEVERLPIGTVVEVIERGSTKETVGKASDYWYRVKLASGKDGWLFGGLLSTFDPSQAEEIYLKIANNKLKIEESSFGDMVDLVNFLSRVIPEVKNLSIAVELRLLHLLALHKSVELIPFDKTEDSQYKRWLKEHDGKVVYSEPSGMWYVRSELLWKLRDEYKGLPIAERIAWEAAKIPIPGECEGYVPCYLALLNMTEGKYLGLYPKGAYVEEALKNIEELVKSIAEDKNNSYEIAKEDRADLQKEIAQLRTAVEKTSSPRKAGILVQLETIRRRFLK
jgi:hypothetical protein